jgi:hypothetical protein
MREVYRRKLETLMRDVADLARAVAIMQVLRGARSGAAEGVPGGQSLDWGRGSCYRLSMPACPNELLLTRAAVRAAGLAKLPVLHVYWRRKTPLPGAPLCAHPSVRTPLCAPLCAQEDPSTGLRVRPEDLFNAFQKLTDENLGVCAAGFTALPPAQRCFGTGPWSRGVKRSEG